MLYARHMMLDARSCLRVCMRGCCVPCARQAVDACVPVCVPRMMEWRWGGVCVLIWLPHATAMSSCSAALFSCLVLDSLYCPRCMPLRLDRSTQCQCELLKRVPEPHPSSRCNKENGKGVFNPWSEEEDVGDAAKGGGIAVEGGAGGGATGGGGGGKKKSKHMQGAAGGKKERQRQRDKGHS